MKGEKFTGAGKVSLFNPGQKCYDVFAKIFSQKGWNPTMNETVARLINEQITHEFYSAYPLFSFST